MPKWGYLRDRQEVIYRERVQPDRSDCTLDRISYGGDQYFSSFAISDSLILWKSILRHT